MFQLWKWIVRWYAYENSLRFVFVARIPFTSIQTNKKVNIWTGWPNGKALPKIALNIVRKVRTRFESVWTNWLNSDVSSCLHPYNFSNKLQLDAVSDRVASVKCYDSVEKVSKQYNISNSLFYIWWQKKRLIPLGCTWSTIIKMPNIISYNNNDCDAFLLFSIC